MITLMETRAKSFLTFILKIVKKEMIWNGTLIVYTLSHLGIQYNLKLSLIKPRVSRVYGIKYNLRITLKLMSVRLQKYLLIINIIVD